MAAFARAVQLGADGIELDVRQAAGGELVIFHDPSVGHEPLDSLSAKAISARAGYSVPTLEEVLDWARGRIALDVELKEDGYVDRVARVLEAFAAGGGALLVTSFLDSVIAQLSEGAPLLRRGLLIHFTTHGAVARARACGAHALVVEERLASDGLLGEATERGLECIIWHLLADGEAHARYLDGRASAVITDDVAWALDARASYHGGTSQSSTPGPQDSGVAD